MSNKADFTFTGNEEQHYKQLKNAVYVGLWRGIGIGLLLGSLITATIIGIVGVLIK